jgi:serine/threonine-protein kinase
MEPLVRTSFNELNAEVSPDGRWLAYESDESGQNEVYVRPFPNVDVGRWQVSRGGGTRPVWARSGGELFYLATGQGSAALMSVPVERQATWTAGTPTKLFEGQYFYTDTGATRRGRTYDVSPDGRRFLMLKDAAGVDDVPASRLVVVQNWTEELKRLVPTN